MTHAELVARAAKWLRTTRRHQCVIQEIGTASYECPDVIGFTAGGFSTLIECKISRSDFLRDADKSFRRRPEMGMGYHRWYAFPQELIDDDTRKRLATGLLMPVLGSPFPVPAKWGVVLFGAKTARVVRKPETFYERNTANEMITLVSAVRRATEGWGRKVFGDFSPVAGQLDPHPSYAKTLEAYREDLERVREERDAALRELEQLRARWKP